MALGGGDLVFGHAGAALDQSGGVALGLADDRVRFGLGALEHGLRFRVGLGGLRLIFAAKRLGLGTKLGGFVQLGADALDLLVEGGADQGRDPLPQQDQDDHHHGERDPGRGVEAERLGLARMLGRADMALGGVGLGVGGLPGRGDAPSQKSAGD